MPFMQSYLITKISRYCMFYYISYLNTEWEKGSRLQEAFRHLIVLPETPHVFLVILHIWPAFKLLDDFGLVPQARWELLHNRHVIAQRLDEIIDIKNIWEIAASHVKRKLYSRLVRDLIFVILAHFSVPKSEIQVLKTETFKCSDV